MAYIFVKGKGGIFLNRVPYRRWRQTGQESDHAAVQPADHEQAESTIGETLILQGIISGVILVLVMLVSILTLEIIEPAQTALTQTLQGATTPRELLTEARQFGVDTLDWQWLE
jgi:hypothetical protein